MVRESEIASGDILFSPFVAAGWSGKAERNLRPAQWLGILKVLLHHCFRTDFLRSLRLGVLSGFMLASSRSLPHFLPARTGVGRR